MASRPAKPPHGSPCNGCGQCCEEVLCPLARHVFGPRRGPCPALRFGPQGSGCGLVEEPAAYAPARVAMMGAEIASATAATLIGAGVGCDAQLVGEPRDPRFERRMEAFRRQNVNRIALSRVAWGILL